MTSFFETNITKLTVRLRLETEVVGSGIIYYEDTFTNKILVLTAAHCLCADGDTLQSPYENISIDIYNDNSKTYQSIENIKLNSAWISKDIDKDLAFVILNKQDVLDIVGEIPMVLAVCDKENEFGNIRVKGFPKAALGEELVSISPSWITSMSGVNKFQLQLHEDYTEYYVRGFSGSGIFTEMDGRIYLLGIFTRFRPEERGKVIYCQYLFDFNMLLRKNFLADIKFSFFGSKGLTQTFFKRHIAKSVANLGPRYNEKLSVNLPISKLFNDLTKDSSFKKRLISCINDWLSSRNLYTRKGTAIHEVLLEIDNFKASVKKWLEELTWEISEVIQVGWIKDGVERIDSLINDKIDELNKTTWEKYKEQNKEDLKNVSPYQNLLSEHISSLRRARNKNYDFVNELTSEINVELANHPILVIKGEAGTGKSHLLGDVCKIRQKIGLPSVLILGQNLHLANSVEENILQQLNLDCSFLEFLIAANDIGRQVGSRFLICVDALNEGGGITLWRDRLAGLINQIKEYSNIGLAVSIRTTYYESLVNDEIKKDQTIHKITHEGFKGSEYRALSLFCSHHNLKQPNFPILSPEFTNPLFLTLICQALVNANRQEFPKGFNGINEIFDLYVASIHSKLSLKREIYTLNKTLFREAIREFALSCKSEDYRELKIDEAISLFEKKFSNYPYLLNDLIQESVFIKNMSNNWKTGTDEEKVYFAYERFGDFYTANDILDGFNNETELLEAFAENGEYSKYLSRSYFLYEGELEALSVLLPERYGLEIFEVYQWYFTKSLGKDADFNERLSRGRLCETLNTNLLKSLKWREPKSINERKVRSWFNSKYFNLDYFDWLYHIVELTAIDDNPLNSDMLHGVLMKYTMPERDGFWQKFLKWFSGYDDHDNAQPIRRLIEWAWSFEVSKTVETETARLVGQTLTWVLSTTDRNLRDETTKAMVNLLSFQPKALLAILKKFADVNDTYISERLYAVTYACVLRNKDKRAIGRIAKFTFKNIFERSCSSTHILLRDYARNIIEYALHIGCKLSIDLKKARPPYKTLLPYFPTDDEVEVLKIKTEDTEYKKRYGDLANRIHHSVLNWDFGRKVMEPLLDDFYPIPFKLESKYKRFVNKFTDEQAGVIENILDLDGFRESMKQNEKKFIKLKGEDAFKETTQRIDEAVLQGYEFVQELFKEKASFVRDEIIPYSKLSKRLQTKTYGENIDFEPIKRWVVKRAFDLGYDYKIHGDYDRTCAESQFNNGNLERIGKKYQWIALHEILGVLCDNYKLKNSWGEHKKAKFYNGSWDLYVRDIDPCSIVKNDFDSWIDELHHSEEFEHFTFDKPDYDFWNQPDQEWVWNVNDLPDPKNILIKKDSNEVKWICLNKSLKWRQPKQIGGKQKGDTEKSIAYDLEAYLVKKREKNGLIKFLKNKSLIGNWLPKRNTNYVELFYREKYWSPAYSGQYDPPKWQTIEYKNKTIKGKVRTTVEASKGSLSEDKSGANENYLMPTQFLMQGLRLDYGSKDGEFVDSAGNLTVISIGSTTTYVKKEAMLKFLEEQELEIIWTVIGEKMAYKSHGGESYFTYPCGIYYSNDNGLDGELNIYERE